MNINFTTEILGLECIPSAGIMRKSKHSELQIGIRNESQTN